jgi:AraC-like DNA-binding protein
LLQDPTATLGLGELARQVGASSRTLQRVFLDEAGIGFSEWRQRARLTHAAGLLESVRPITEVSLAVGYTSHSAFTAAFRRAFGRTPAAFRANLASRSA